MAEKALNISFRGDTRYRKLIQEAALARDMKVQGFLEAVVKPYLDDFSFEVPPTIAKSTFAQPQDVVNSLLLQSKGREWANTLKIVAKQIEEAVAGMADEREIDTDANEFENLEGHLNETDVVATEVERGALKDPKARGKVRTELDQPRKPASGGSKG